MPNIHHKCRKHEQDIQKMKMTFKVGSDHLISLYIWNHEKVSEFLDNIFKTNQQSKIYKKKLTKSFMRR